MLLCLGASSCVGIVDDPWASSAGLDADGGADEDAGAALDASVPDACAGVTCSHGSCAPDGAAMEKVKVDSPRGAWTLSRAHNPVQNIYLRKVVGKENKVTGIAAKALADPAPGCKL